MINGSTPLTHIEAILQGFAANFGGNATAVSEFKKRVEEVRTHQPSNFPQVEALVTARLNRSVNQTTTAGAFKELLDVGNIIVQMRSPNSPTTLDLDSLKLGKELIGSNEIQIGPKKFGN